MLIDLTLLKLKFARSCKFPFQGGGTGVAGGWYLNFADMQNSN